MNKTRLILLSFISSVFFSFAQESNQMRIDLEWEVAQVFTSKKNELQVPMVKGQFLDDHQLPVYSKKWSVTNGYNSVRYTVENVQYANLSDTELIGLDRQKIPSTLQSDLKVSKSRKASSLSFLMTPIVNDGGLLRKVVSFDLVYTLEQGLQARGAQRTSRRTFNSVLSSGNWYKFAVDTTGVFKLDRNFLESLGINVSDVNPQHIKIYGNGGAMLPTLNGDFRNEDLQENAIYVHGEEDGRFDGEDYILFYAKGPNQWFQNPNRNTANHQINIYAEESYYFINVEGEDGKRIADLEPASSVASFQINTFNDFTFYEKEEHSLFTIGQQWFGEVFTIDNVQSFTIPFENIDSSVDLTIRVRGAVESYSTSSMTIKANGQELFQLDYPAVILGSLTKAYAREGVGTIAASGDAVTVEVSFNNNGNPSAIAHLDYIEVLGRKQLTVNDRQFGFRSHDLANSTGVGQFQVANGSEIWDVTDFLNPKRIINQSSGANFEFNYFGGSLYEFVALHEEDYYTPIALSNSYVENQNLHGLENIEYIIVTRDYLMNEVERLAEYHRARGLTVEVVDIEQIYNEFASGSPDLTAIRDFTRYLYQNATTDDLRVKYICLFGDASYDYKDRITGNNNIVPAVLAYESFNLATSYMTDDYYGMMDDDEGNLIFSDQLDIATGRIPITTTAQASEAIDKIINYSSTNSYGDWRNQVTLVADDVDVTTEAILQASMEQIADSINDRKPILNVEKIYADAYVQETTAGGDRYPTVYSQISNTIEKGTLLMNYFGHGGEDGWASEQILRIPLVQDLKNFDALPLIITITCDFSRFDNPLRRSGGEYLIWNKDGGSISLITTTREIYINVGKIFNERLMKVLLNFDDEELTISESMMDIKNQFTTSQRLFIYFLGDPAMELAVPRADVKLTSMNGVDVSQSLDTIKALSKNTFEGIVTDPSGNVLTDYNGEVSTIIFDKSISKTTLDNDNRGIIMDFEALESKLFRGRASVENGRFAFDFVAPKDLRIAYGEGKISFYTDNGTIEKAGYNFDVIIGGINENAEEDNIGPEIQLYMNDETFVDGGNTNSSPYLLAVLQDANGINTSITSVDHDIVAILDGDTSNPYILNDYYQTELNDFTKGSARFPFRDLESGLHTVELCAWDTYNNVSCATLSFVVVNDSDMVLDNVLNYPNPFVNYTEFWFNHNKPNETLEVQIQIFTVSGKLVKTINQSVQSTGNLSRSISWDGLDDFGDRIGKGVYVYKLSVRSSLSDVKAEKYEKLVILQ